MTSKPAKNCCGFTLFEFAAAASLFGLLVGALLVRIPFYQGEAERVAAEQLVGTLRTALQVRAAEALARADEQGLQRLAVENPMAWLSKTPKNYLGEYYAPTIDELPKGHWFYDKNDASLVYLPNSDKSFSIQTSKFLKFKVKLFRLPSTQDKDQRKINKGIILDQVDDRVAVNN